MKVAKRSYCPTALPNLCFRGRGVRSRSGSGCGPWASNLRQAPPEKPFRALPRVKARAGLPLERYRQSLASAAAGNGLLTLAWPKSAILSTPFALISRFAGFMSRCNKPCRRWGAGAGADARDRQRVRCRSAGGSNGVPFDESTTVDGPYLVRRYFQP